MNMGIFCCCSEVTCLCLKITSSTLTGWAILLQGSGPWPPFDNTASFSDSSGAGADTILTQGGSVTYDGVSTWSVSWVGVDAGGIPIWGGTYTLTSGPDDCPYGTWVLQTDDFPAYPEHAPATITTGPAIIGVEVDEFCVPIP